MFETNPEFNNIVPPVSSNHKKSTKIIVFILILIVVIVGVYFFINNYKQNNKTPVTSQKQIFSILDTTKMPVGFLADFPKNGLIKVLGSEQKDVNSAKTEGVLSFSSTKTVQENFDFYKKYLIQNNWVVTKDDSIVSGTVSGYAIKIDDRINFNFDNFTDTTKSTKSVVQIIIFTNKK